MPPMPTRRPRQRWGSCQSKRKRRRACPPPRDQGRPRTAVIFAPSSWSQASSPNWRPRAARR
eukprot:5089045-Pyramimonas_sp.AAC.1